MDNPIDQAEAEKPTKPAKPERPLFRTAKALEEVVEDFRTYPWAFEEAKRIRREVKGDAHHVVQLEGQHTDQLSPEERFQRLGGLVHKLQDLQYCNNSLMSLPIQLRALMDYYLAKRFSFGASGGAHAIRKCVTEHIFEIEKDLWILDQIRYLFLFVFDVFYFSMAEANSIYSLHSFQGRYNNGYYRCSVRLVAHMIKGLDLNFRVFSNMFRVCFGESIFFYLSSVKKDTITIFPTRQAR